MSDVLRVHQLHHTYPGPVPTPVLKDINLTLKAGEMVGLLGASGSGKSTLLHCLSYLDRPTSGDVVFLDQNLGTLSDSALVSMRAHHLGFVYQFHHLLPEFTALENVMIPQLLIGKSEKEARDNAYALLEKMQLSERVSHRPSTLSGGEQQRVAIARALINRPSLLLADEPTGNLDETTAQNVFNLMREMLRELSLSALIVTHNASLAQKMDRVLTIEQGSLKA